MRASSARMGRREGRFHLEDRRVVWRHALHPKVRSMRHPRVRSRAVRGRLRRTRRFVRNATRRFVRGRSMPTRRFVRERRPKVRPMETPPEGSFAGVRCATRRFVRERRPKVRPMRSDAPSEGSSDAPPEGSLPGRKNERGARPKVRPAVSCASIRSWRSSRRGRRLGSRPRRRRRRLRPTARTRPGRDACRSASRGGPTRR